jgi:hypothetical protein
VEIGFFVIFKPLINRLFHDNPKKCRYCLSKNVIRHGGRRHLCKDCGRTSSRPKNITRKLRRSAEQWLLDRSALRRVGERTSADFTTKWRLAQRYAEHVPSPLENYKRNRHLASGILVLDALFVGVKGRMMAVMVAYDTGLGVIDCWIDVTENKTGYFYLFQRLDAAGYRPICVVSDGHSGIVSAVSARNLPHQLCVFHLLRSLRSHLGAGFGTLIRPKDRVLYGRIRHVLKTRRIEDLPGRINGFRHFERIFPGRKEVFRWFWKIVVEATLHLSYSEKVPMTNGDIERLNGHIRARLKTFRGVKSERSLNNLLKILFHFRKYK